MIASPATGDTANKGAKGQRDHEPSSRTRILLGALPLFTDRGYAAVSMQDIADAVGMTKAALYYHFSDKEELFGHVYAFEMERIAHELEHLLAGTDDVRTTLEMTARYLLDTRQGDLRRLHADFSRYVGVERKGALLKGRTNPYNVLWPSLEHAKAAGKTRDINVGFILTLFFAMISRQMNLAAQGSVLHSTAPALTNEEIAREISELVLYGIHNPEENASR